MTILLLFLSFKPSLGDFESPIVKICNSLDYAFLVYTKIEISHEDRNYSDLEILNAVLIIEQFMLL